MTAGTNEIYEIGQSPPIGEVPEQMYAQVIRRERFGEPSNAFQIESVLVPKIGPGEVLAAGRQRRTPSGRGARRTNTGDERAG